MKIPEVKGFEFSVSKRNDLTLRHDIEISARYIDAGKTLRMSDEPNLEPLKYQDYEIPNNLMGTVLKTVFKHKDFGEIDLSTCTDREILLMAVVATHYSEARILIKAEPEKIIVNWEPGYKMLESQEIVIDTITFLYDGKQLETKTSHHDIVEGHLIRSISAWLNIPVDLIVINDPEILNRYYGCGEGEGL